MTYPKPCEDVSDVSRIEKINSIDRVIQEEYDLLDEPGDIYPIKSIMSLDSEIVNKDQDDMRIVRQSTVEQLKTYSLVRVDSDAVNEYHQ